MTRAVDQIEPLAHGLRALGAEPIALSLIDIAEPSDGGAALRDALDTLGTFDWLVLSSPNGAVRVAEALHQLGEHRPLVAAVGTATAAALSVPADLVPRRQIAEGLLAEFPDGGGTVLLAQAEQALGLVAKGWDLTVVPAYRTQPRIPTPDEQSTALGADAVLFASGSAVSAWVDVFGTEISPPVFAIGPATAQVAHQLGLKVTAVAADHSLDGLVDCLRVYFLGLS
jgi:uroporphyrinogen-III synthase